MAAHWQNLPYDPGGDFYLSERRTLGVWIGLDSLAVLGLVGLHFLIPLLL